MKYKDIKATYEREIAGKSENKAKFYAVGATLAVILYLILGIRPLALTSAENRKLLFELRSIEQQLRVKNIKISTSFEELKDLNDQVEILNQKIPNEAMLEKYLEDLVLLTSRSGFVIQRFRQQSLEEGEISIEIELTGNISSLPMLVNEIETNPRFTVIRNVSTVSKGALTDVKLTVQIFLL